MLVSYHSSDLNEYPEEYENGQGSVSFQKALEPYSSPGLDVWSTGRQLSPETSIRTSLDVKRVG